MGTVAPSSSRLGLSRRTFLGAAAAGVGLFSLRPARAAFSEKPRCLTLQNLHTGERVKSEYWCEGSYVPDALGEIARVLRDHRTGSVHPINIDLLDLLHHLNGGLEVTSPFHVISGYRSSESNAKLAAANNGVAKKSLHMQGMAIDIRVPGVDLRNLQKAAKAMARGGVGYYAESNFVHVDVGRVRYW